MNVNNVSGSIQATGAQTLVLFAYSNDKKVACEAKNENESRELIFLAGAEGRFKGGLKENIFFRWPVRTVSNIYSSWDSAIAKRLPTKRYESRWPSR